MILVNNYIPAIKQESIISSTKLDQVINWINKGQGSIVISSGYAHEFYHHDWLLDALNDSSDFEDVRYIVCCYGPMTPFLDTLRAKASGLKQALVIHGLNPAEFDYVLELADVYVRASDVDSFGIAAWDAAAKGAAVVASNVCERPPEAIVHPKGNRRAFLASLRAALALHPREQKEIKGVKNRVNIESFLKLKYFNETKK
ncbi:glycosyltransferase [Sphingobium scionense]